MKLPSRVKVGRTWYDIVPIEEYGELCAAWRPMEKKILIARKSLVSRHTYTAAEKAEAFWHELIHAILHDMGEHKLNRSEKFVDAFAVRLNNAIRSAKFAPKFDVQKWKRENL